MKIRVIRKSPPISGCLINVGAQGEAEIRDLGVNLDETPSTVRLFTDGTLGRPYLDEQGLSLGEGEQIEFDIYAITRMYSYEWVVDLTVESTSEPPSTVTIDYGGRSFFSTAFAPHYERIYKFGLTTGVFAIDPSGEYRQ
jgi:hypothetical protein